jgi:bacteriorhodopsin
MDVTIGVALLAVAVLLVFIARPNRSGQHQRFLQFEAAMVLYPPLVMIFAVMGMAEIVTSVLGISH